MNTAVSRESDLRSNGDAVGSGYGVKRERCSQDLGLRIDVGDVVVTPETLQELTRGGTTTCPLCSVVSGGSGSSSVASKASALLAFCCCVRFLLLPRVAPGQTERAGKGWGVRVVVRSWTKSLLETRRCGPQAGVRGRAAVEQQHRHSPVALYQLDLWRQPICRLRWSAAVARRCSWLPSMPTRSAARASLLRYLLLPFIPWGPRHRQCGRGTAEYRVSMLDGGSSMAGVRDACEEGLKKCCYGVSRFVIFVREGLGRSSTPSPTGVWKTRRM